MVESREFPGVCEKGHKLRYYPSIHRVGCPFCDVDWIFKELEEQDARDRAKQTR